MADWVPFSKRKKLAEEAGKPLLYLYDTVPEALRAQAVMILQRALGTEMSESYGPRTVAHQIWTVIVQRLREEYGLFKLWEHGGSHNPDMEVLNFLLSASTERFLDAVELSLRVRQNVDERLRDSQTAASGITITADEAIKQMNYRFQENRFGYTYVSESKRIIRIDSQYIHKEAVERAVLLLQTSGFAGAENEFEDAHTEYRHRHYKDAITKALNAVESTMKTICDNRKWAYPPNASSKDLIKVIFDHELVAKSHETFFSGLRTVLESGLPTVRNKSTASHGQGAAVVQVPSHVAGFALHLAASTIVLLVEADKAKQ